jgi:hypothetical protein
LPQATDNYHVFAFREFYATTGVIGLRFGQGAGIAASAGIIIIVSPKASEEEAWTPISRL